MLSFHKELLHTIVLVFYDSGKVMLQIYKLLFFYKIENECFKRFFKGNKHQISISGFQISHSVNFTEIFVLLITKAH